MIFQILLHRCFLSKYKVLPAIAAAILIGAYAPNASSQDEEQSLSSRQMLARRAQEARKKEIITQGELVQWLSSVVDNLDQQFPGGAGAAIHAALNALNASSSETDASKPVESTQLQTFAPLFHELFQRVGYPEPAAWTNLAAYRGKSVPITVAQAEALFSFDFAKVDASNDLNHNGIADWWERYYYPESDVDSKALAARGDGSTILEAFERGVNPLDFYNGRPPKLTIVGGSDQKASPEGFVASPLIVKVSDADGKPIPGAPMTFTCTLADGQLQSSSSGSPKTTLTVLADNNGQATVYFQSPSTKNATCQVVAKTTAPSSTIQQTFTESSNNGTGPFYPAPNDLDSSFDPERPVLLPERAFACIDMNANVTQGSVTKVAINDKNEAAFAVDGPTPPQGEHDGFPKYQVYTWKNGQASALPPVKSADYVGEYDGSLGGEESSLWNYYNLDFLTSGGEMFGDTSIVAVPNGDLPLPPVDTGLKPSWWTSKRGAFFLPLPDTKKVHQYASMAAVSDEGYFGGWGYCDLDHVPIRPPTITGPFGFVGDPKGNYVFFDSTPDYEGVKLPDTIVHVASSFVPVAVNNKGLAVGHPFNAADAATFWDGQHLVPMGLKGSTLVALNDQGQAIFQVQNGEGGLWEGGKITILRYHLSPNYRGLVRNIQPYVLSNQAVPSSDGTIYMLATAQEKDKPVTLVCSRDKDGDWSFEKMSAPDSYSNMQFTSINSSGVVAGLGTPKAKASTASQNNSADAKSSDHPDAQGK